DEAKIKATWDFMFELYRNGMVKANHDVNKGGFIISIAEMCFKNILGAELDLSHIIKENLRDDQLLFSESYGRFIVETDPKDYDNIQKLAQKYSVDAKKIGVLISNPKIKIRGLGNKDLILDVQKLKENYDSTIPNLMEI
ncbi:MAG: hypothetical protein KAV01_05370, partial [Candidatus Lokiarchaeota archaeon]|nr:hypothetical protein [Candidatus Lokiarchaeota archaeon]